MKYFPLLIIAFSFLNFNTLKAQEHPVKWAFSTEKIDNETAYFIIEAEIAEGWRVFGEFPYLEERADAIPTIHVGKSIISAYSKCDNNIGPICLDIIYKNPNLTFGQIVSSEKVINNFSPLFDSEVFYYENKIRLKQRFKKVENQKLAGYVTYFVCNNEKCYPPIDIDFSITFPE